MDHDLTFDTLNISIDKKHDQMLSSQHLLQTIPFMLSSHINVSFTLEQYIICHTVIQVIFET